MEIFLVCKASAPHLVDCDSVRVTHLVKLVYAHDAAVSEYHRTSFELPVARLAVFGDGCSEPNAG